MTTATPELLNCPFCGGNITLREEDDPQFYFDCDSCGHSFNHYADSLQDAIAMMNSRPSQTAPDVEALKKIQTLETGAYEIGWNDCIDHLAEHGLLNAKPLEPIEGLEDAVEHYKEHGVYRKGDHIIFAEAARAYLEATKRGG